MIEDKELGIKIAEDTDEAFWTDMKEKTINAIKTEERNIKINKKLSELCDEELNK